MGLIVKQLSDQTDALVAALEPYAEKYRKRLKFTFFTKAPTTKTLCDVYGIWSNDELLLLEKPSQTRTSSHSHVPLPPKYRLEEVTPARLKTFFDDYDSGKLPRYYKPAAARAPPFYDSSGIRELTGWDFAEVVLEPSSAVLVEFVSANCSACEEFASSYRDVAQRLETARRKDPRAFPHLILARIDQSANEHSELIKGTPWLRYWPPGRRKKSVEVEPRGADNIWSFLEEQAAEELSLKSEDAQAVDEVAAVAAGESACSASGGNVGCETSDVSTPVKLGSPSSEAVDGYLSTAVDPED